MKGNSEKRAIFLEIGRSITQSKQRTKKEVYSFFQSNTQSIKNTTLMNVPPIHQTSTTTKRKISLPYPPKINNTALVSGMNDQFLYNRKQNHLNTCFNERKNKLREISKENKLIHKRLNSQKSIYSSTDLNKSFESTSQIKKRLSQSKLSQRMNSSRSSSRGALNTGQNKRLVMKKKEPIKIKASSINDAKGSDLKGFQALFSLKPNLSTQKESRMPQKVAYSTTKKYEAVSTSLRQSYGKTVPAISSSNQRQVPKHLGGILHRIAQVMYSAQGKIQPKTTKGYLKPKKTFIF